MDNGHDNNKLDTTWRVMTSLTVVATRARCTRTAGRPFASPPTGAGGHVGILEALVATGQLRIDARELGGAPRCGRLRRPGKLRLCARSCSAGPTLRLSSVRGPR